MFAHRMYQWSRIWLVAALLLVLAVILTNLERFIQIVSQVIWRCADAFLPILLLLVFGIRTIRRFIGRR